MSRTMRPDLWKQYMTRGSMRMRCTESDTNRGLVPDHMLEAITHGMADGDTTPASACQACVAAVAGVYASSFKNSCRPITMSRGNEDM